MPPVGTTTPALVYHQGLEKSCLITDYAIARRIIDLHSTDGESIERIYTIEDIQRYILFSRQFKPIVSEEAAKQLVDHYRSLRQRDATGTSKSSWRITVRQLESMIRLSEALARLHCSEVVETRHVKEAYRLLNKSIIRVEQPDINLYEEEDEDQEHLEMNDINGDAEEHEKMEVDGESKPKDQVPSKEIKTLKLSYEAYKSLSNLLVMYLQREESKAEEKSELGIKRSDLINWYLKEIESEIETEEELIIKKLTVEKVIDRLIEHDQIIIPLSKQGLKGDSEEMEEDDPILVVHPNYVPEIY
ncbi:DNA replication licensing factor MCM6-like [Centruroides sculpturatus]|uniref:DNA replication licensing factor MCM6-like n=1 Tax=Centruroides sculpturatus TaxID=218467 RepID=UPI000C6DACAA|nr:DNA replication licensing factor MCM6-like [Centruroides sculpturatus]